MRHRISITVMLLGVVSCGHGEQDLGNGPKVVDFSSGNYGIISSSGEDIVLNKIEFYCKKESKVKGYRIHPGDDNALLEDPEFWENLGYFELDVPSRKVAYFPEVTRDEAIKKCS